VKVEKVLSETSSGQAIQTPDVTVNEQQKRIIAPNDLERMDISDGIVEVSDSSRRRKKLDSEIIHEGHSLRGTTTRRALRYEHPVLKTQASPQASTRESSSDSEENGGSDASSASTSDSAWSPGKSHSHHGTKRSAANYAAYSDSNTEEDEDEDEEDGEDGVEDDQVLNKFAGKKRPSSSLDEMKRKRGRPSVKIVKPETDLASADDDETNGTTTAGLLVEGYIIKRHGHDWHKPGTKRGRTYVSRRRPVTESEKVKTLQKARQVQIKHPSFLKQLHKDSCYRSLKLVSLSLRLMF